MRFVELKGYEEGDRIFIDADKVDSVRSSKWARDKHTVYVDVFVSGHPFMVGEEMDVVLKKLGIGV